MSPAPSTRSTGTLRVRFTSAHRHAGRSFAAGDVADLPADVVARIRALGVTLEDAAPPAAKPPAAKTARKRRKPADE